MQEPLPLPPAALGSANTGTLDFALIVVLLRVGLMLLADGASDSRLDVCGATRMMLV